MTKDVEKELTKLTAYTFKIGEKDNHNIRVHLDSDDQPWFVVKDLAEALDLTGHSSTTTLVERIPEAFEDYLSLGTISNSAGIVREARMVAEPACYYLILTSRAENAFPMCRWICEDILPSIRKTGSYSVVGNSDTVPAEFKDLQKLIHTYQQEVASGMFEATKQLRQDSASLKGKVENLTSSYADLRQIVANNDKAIIDNQQHLIGGQKSLYDMIHEQAVPITEQPVKRKYNRKNELAYTDDELSYYQFLSEELRENMGSGKAQVSGYINTCWRRRFGYRLEGNSENATTGTHLLGVAAKEHQLQLKYPDNDLVKRLEHSTDNIRPHHRELLSVMENEASMETGKTYSIEKFLEAKSKDSKVEEKTIS
jgi:prophage antirepressor-like protein